MHPVSELIDLPLFPPPTERRAGPPVSRPERVRVEVSAGGDVIVRQVFERRGVPFESVASQAHLRIFFSDCTGGRPDSGVPIEAQAYRLFVQEGVWHLEAGGDAGVRYGLDTFAQIWRRAVGPLMAGGEIIDRPALAVRGWMLDISRCRVPTMATLANLVDILADWRINQFQLYTEHTFAYPGHERVWGDASPLSAADYLQLDQLCRARGIELVPNQNSFGHFERWLRYPEYTHLAECPDGFHHPGGRRWTHGTTLCPGAVSFAFVQSLYDALLPSFSSGLVNIGGDEPWELGQGRSRDRCRKEGKLSLYLSFLRSLIEDVRSRGRTPLFWADVLLEEGGGGGDIPPEARPLIWGYEADHPFEAQAARIAGLGRRFFLCPGTACWNSLGGRLETARENLRRAAGAAMDHRAEGLLMTSWGDGGHHQPYAVSLAALAYGASRAWSPVADPDRLVGPALEWALGADTAFIQGLLALGELSSRAGSHRFNRSALVDILLASDGSLSAMTSGLDADCLAALSADLAKVEASFSGHACGELCAGVDVAAGLLAVATDRGRYFLRCELGAQASELRARMHVLLGQFEEAWLATSRPGGLHESSGHLRKVLDFL